MKLLSAWFEKNIFRQPLPDGRGSARAYRQPLPYGRGSARGPFLSSNRRGGDIRTTSALSLLILSGAVLGQTPVEVAPVEARIVERTLKLPGEFLPYESVALRSRVPAFVDQVLVDRGSRVQKGQRLIELSAPEMTAQLAEARSKVQVAQGQKAEEEAQLAAARSTADRLEQASATPGAIAGRGARSRFPSP